jgi:hypothetical protein
MEEGGGAFMVRAKKTTSILSIVLVSVFAAALLLPFITFASGQGVGSAADFTIEEQYTVELTSTGDAHVTDVLTYDDAWFSDNSSVFEEYPNLLSRRYRDNTDVGEIENFDAKVNQKKSTVTITFDSPGYAYNMGDNWAVYGFGYEPSKQQSGEMVFEGEGTMNNEFTLFEEIPFTITTTVKFPQGASNPKYDAADSIVTYELPYKTAKLGNFLQDSKGVWIPIFIVLMLLSLILLLYVVLNSRRSTVVAAGPGAGPGAGMPLPPPVPPVQAAPVAPAPSAAAAPPAAPAPSVEAAAVEPPVKQRFCKHCGSALKEADKSFCSSCGKPLE